MFFRNIYSRIFWLPRNVVQSNLPPYMKSITFQIESQNRVKQPLPPVRIDNRVNNLKTFRNFMAMILNIDLINRVLEIEKLLKLGYSRIYCFAPANLL